MSGPHAAATNLKLRSNAKASAQAVLNALNLTDLLYQIEVKRTCPSFFTLWSRDKQLVPERTVIANPPPYGCDRVGCSDEEY